MSDLKDGTGAGGMLLQHADCAVGGDKKAIRKRGKQPHGALVNATIRLLYAFGCYVWDNKSGGWTNSEGRTIRYGKVGSADVIGISPTGRFVAAEVKVGKDFLKPEQIDFRDRIIEKNGIHIEVRSIEDIQAREAEIRGRV